MRTLFVCRHLIFLYRAARCTNTHFASCALDTLKRRDTRSASYLDNKYDELDCSSGGCTGRAAFYDERYETYAKIEL